MLVRFPASGPHTNELGQAGRLVQQHTYGIMLASWTVIHTLTYLAGQRGALLCPPCPLRKQL